MSDQSYVGVIGSGTMGAGIAQVAATAGHSVFLVDTSLERAESSRDRIASGLRKVVEKGKMTQADADAVLERITPSESLHDLQFAGYVIEAVFESFETKAEILNDLGAILPEDTVVASNTSSISITRLAECFARPELVIGMHFFNPVPVMTLVELIRGRQTSDETAETAREMAKAFGKTPIDVRDSPGFVVNRVMMPMIKEAIALLQEEVASREGIDDSMRLGAAHPMGPLQLADLIGLDVVLSIMEVLRRDLDDPWYEPPRLLRDLVEAGKLGRKTREGFYVYD
jgi:3-hydroxybutyryl-CoA dehydrogenase